MIVKAAITWETVDDLVRHLGVPAKRILLRPTPGTATEKDLIRAQSGPHERLCELIDGVLVEKPMGWHESLLAGWIIQQINNYLDKHDLGVALATDGFQRMASGRVRAPDVSFISWDRISGEEMDDDPIAPFGPDLAIEVLSRSNTRKEMKLKRQDYFPTGCQLVWEIDPRKQTTRIYTSVEDYTEIGKTGILDGGDVLPGFTLSLKALFARGQRRKK